MNFKSTTPIIALAVSLTNQNVNAMETSSSSSDEYTFSSSENTLQASTFTSRSSVRVKIKKMDFPFLESYIPNDIYRQCFEEFLNSNFVYINNKAYELRSGMKIKKDGIITCEYAKDALPATYRNRDRKYPIIVKSIEANLTSEILYLNYVYTDEWFNWNGRQWAFQVSTNLEPNHAKEIKKALGLEPPVEEIRTITKITTSTQNLAATEALSVCSQPTYVTQTLNPQYATQTLNPQFTYGQQPYGTQTFNPQLGYGQAPYGTQTITPQYGQYMMSNTQFCQPNSPYQR